jgi:demethylmenaquinone methyltransferase/2-methoxy-6-polyprenyl-1,4-benzoquinol methylase
MRLDNHGAQFGAPVLWHRSLPRVRFGSRNQSRKSDVSWDTDTLPEGDTKSAMVRAMFDAIAPRYDMVNRIMTFRLDVRWRKRAVRELRLPRGSTVLDLASGTGDLCVDLLKAGHKPLSMDLSFGMLSADRSGSPRAQSDILRLPVADGAVDGAMCGFALRNLVDLDVFFRELARVVRPGGRISLLDVGIPHRRIVRFGNDIYFGKVVPRIGALLSDGAAYRYLPRSVSYLPPREKLVQMLRDAGFADATHEQLSGGITQMMTGTRNP